jgi:uncharacterized protein (TIGR03067 family)
MNLRKESDMRCWRFLVLARIWAVTAVVTLAIPASPARPPERPAAGEQDREKAIKALEKFGGSVWYPKKDTDYTVVAISQPGLSAAGLKEAVVYLRQLPNLRALSLSFTQMNDLGLACLKELPGLEALFLKVTRVTDAGLPHLYKMTGLREIDLTLTRVTDKGVAALKKALPRAKVTYSGAGEPAAETEKLRGTWRGEFVLRGGDNRPKHEFFLFIAGNDMSLGGLVLDRFTLHPDRKPKGIDLESMDNVPGFNNGAHNRGIYRLEGDTLTLCLGRGVRPREFSSEAKGVLLYTFKREKVSVLDDIEALEKLGGSLLHHRPDAGPDFTMVVFGDRPGLSDAEWKEAVALLRKGPDVPALSLSFTQVTDARLASLKELPGLRRLYLKVTPVTDAGLRHLQKMPGLREIDLTLTRVTDEGVAALKKALPKAKIVYSGTGKPAEETEKLRGTWQGELILPDNKKINEKSLLTIAGNDMSRGSLIYHFTLDPGSNPKSIDVKIIDAIPGCNSPESRLLAGRPLFGQGPWGSLLGIYRLEGDILTLCLEPIHGDRAERPKTFSPEGRKRWMYIYKRVKE